MLDAVTTTTDAGGHFHLRTGSRLDSGCAPFTLTITAPGHPSYSQGGTWHDPHEDPWIFVLSLGEPKNNVSADC